MAGSALRGIQLGRVPDLSLPKTCGISESMGARGSLYLALPHCSVAAMPWREGAGGLALD